MALLLLGGCASGGGTTTQTKTPDGDVVTTYDDPEHGIRLTYPGDWEEQSVPFMIRSKGTIIVLAARGEVSENKMPPTISVVAQKSPRTDDLEAMERQSIDKARQQFGDFRLVETSPATLGGEPARRIIYTGTKLGVSLEVMNVIALHKGKAFAVVYSADPGIFPDQRRAAQSVIDSLQWAK